MLTLQDRGDRQIKSKCKSKKAGRGDGKVDTIVSQAIINLEFAKLCFIQFFGGNLGAAGVPSKKLDLTEPEELLLHYLPENLF